MYLDTRPGREDKLNEDYVAATVNSTSARAVLLDGAGGPSELPTGCNHGTPWYVNQLGDHLMFNMRNPSTPLTTALALALDAVAESHGVWCDLNNPGTPSSTVIMARRVRDRVEYLVLGDSTFVADVNGEIITVTDKRIDEVGADLWQAMAALPTGTPEHQAARIAFVENQRRMRNKRVGGYPIASNDPDAAYESLTGAFSTREVRRVALLSDGATRFVEFGLGSFADALDILGSAAPGRLFDRVREAEASDPAGARWPRAKRQDDIAAAYLPGHLKVAAAGGIVGAAMTS
ncbi:protein phosphatase 2C domain-containing protein (plasmid) [Nonomuraea sp. CA-143628]|uniref:protein phosphatase 2C domain-containing protein n=1 Tax=Nonomuraea sp. CA-143628 TaxID=3239997 RepID=UPI003D93C6E8